MDDAINIDSLLQSEGFSSPSARAQVRALLEQHGLTNPRKQNIASEKRARVTTLIADHVVRVCGRERCAQLAQALWPERAVVVSERPRCFVCDKANRHMLRAVLDVDEWLRREGFLSAEACALARVLLERHGLLAAAQQYLLRAQFPAARALFATELRCICDDDACQALAAARWPEELLVEVAAQHCVVCSGSNLRRAVEELIDGLAHVGITRLLVVGGATQQRIELSRFFEDRAVKLRLVEGDRGPHTARHAQPHLAWAQLLVVWSTCELAHSFAEVYVDHAPPTLRIVRVTRRGISRFCQDVQAGLGVGSTNFF